MKPVDRIIGVFMALLSVLCFWETHRVWNGWGGTGSMPLIVGSIFGLLSVIFFITPHQVRVESVNRKEAVGLLFIGGSFALYIVIINWLGFLISTWLFLAIVAMYISRSRPLSTIVWTGAVAACAHFIFRYLLGMYLPTGFMRV